MYGERNDVGIQNECYGKDSAIKTTRTENGTYLF
jgi:hypothetical protein